MSPRLLARLPLAAALSFAVACGGSGSSGPTIPAHQASAESAHKLAGIGDSMMQGMDVIGDNLLEDVKDHPEYSFAQGTEDAVLSLYSRYKLVSGLPGEMEFASHSGAEMVLDYPDTPNAARQAEAICAQGTKPDRVVVMLGANDVCNATSLEHLPATVEFGEALGEALDTLGACLPDGAWVHVLSVPRVDGLRAAALAKDEAAGNQRCKNTWAFASIYGSICPIVTEGATETLAEIGHTIDGYNDELAAQVEAADAAYGTAATVVRFTTDWDGVDGAPSIGTFVFQPGDLSGLDCFHPSVEGQRKLACAAWESWEGMGNADACF